jgi:hypothetical protein
MAQQERSTPPRKHTDHTSLHSALWLPIFDALADPTMVARLAAEAEEAGWHGVFVWDHLRWRAPVRQVADPAPYAKAGATWLLAEFPWDTVSVDHVRSVLREGPATP